ncbi:MAG: hypothetical protein ACXAD7_16305 [Candidatus Kariarchaeaceae archaeon]
MIFLRENVHLATYHRGNTLVYVSPKSRKPILEHNKYLYSMNFDLIKWIIDSHPRRAPTSPELVAILDLCENIRNSILNIDPSLRFRSCSSIEVEKVQDMMLPTDKGILTINYENITSFSEELHSKEIFHSLNAVESSFSLFK